MSESSILIGALATHELVGRQEELTALQTAIVPLDLESFQCLALVASGGLGKTRLLREAFDRLLPPRGQMRRRGPRTPTAAPGGRMAAK